MTYQTRTSAGTSINSTKLPRVYSAYGIKGNTFDYGCGRYTEHIRAAFKSAGFEYYGFDPYNQTEKQNAESMLGVSAAGRLDYVYCSNVLNVIDSDDVVRGIIRALSNLAGQYNATVVVTVYEGDGSGIGRETKSDCYQRNQRTAEYIKYFDDVLGAGRAFIKKGCIIVRP